MKSVPPSLFNLGATKANHVDMWLLLLQSGAELYPRCVGRGSAARGIGHQATVLSTLVRVCRQEGRAQDQECVGLTSGCATAEADLSGSRSHHSGPRWMDTESVIFDFIVGLMKALML